MDGSRIITSTQELERAERATYSLITYYNYIKAWIVCLNRQYGSGDDGINSFKAKIRNKTAFRSIQREAQVSRQLTSAYLRGLLTLTAMRRLPFEDYPQLTISANYWLPVQSYYAIHGIGLATMMALNRGLPNSHRTFRADFSELLNTYFPDPFCGRCTGGPEKKDFSFQKLSTSIEKVIRLKQLRNPEFVQEVETFIGKSLSTTRERFLNERFKEKRRKLKKKRLCFEDMNECCQKEHATSICDLIYRMRVHSNYDNPDMYLFASHDVAKAAKHYKDLLFLTEILIAGLEALIERRIGSAEMARLKSGFD